MLSIRLSVIRASKYIVATGFLAAMAFGQSPPSNVDATAGAGSDGSLRETPRLDRAPEPVAFVNGDVRLAGGLVKPVGHGPFPAVIFVHGAGPATGNEPAFVVHANAFLSRGFAVLMYDKRGSGGSTGKLETSDYNDLANDVGAAVKFLRARQDIVPTKIGILGRSEGGWVGTIAARRDPSIAFVIMSSGAADKPYDETLYWTRGALRAHGASESVIEQAVAAKTRIWDYYRSVANGKDGDAATSHATRDAIIKSLREFQRYRPEIPSGVMDPSTEDVREFRAFAQMIYYDPAPDFEALRVPLLELLGMNDEVVDPKTTTAALERLRSTGHDVTIRTFAGVGHSLVVMDGTKMVGYPSGYLEFATQWASEHVK
jgi:uncharacterized protein